MSKKIEEIYQQLGILINTSIEDDWVKAWIKARMHEGNAEFEFLYQKNAKSTPLPFDESVSPVIGKIYKSFKELREILKQPGQSPWHTATFTLESNGKFKLDYEYD
jgi:hypothetical protein